MKTNKKQREQENKILAENALKSYMESYTKSLSDGGNGFMYGVDFVYDTELKKEHIKCIAERYLKNDTVLRLQEIVNNN